jgi:glycerophosphoryl diester phosphodiesterase
MRRALIAAAAAAFLLGGCDAGVRDGDQEIAVVAEDGVTLPLPADLPAYFNCLRERGVVAVSAHRGGPAPGFAENALPTLDNTLRVAPGVFLEVDIARTADGVLVLMHDDRAERTTTGSGAIAELDMEQLLAFRLEDDSGRAVDARVPTLRETLDWAGGRTVLELDIKRGVRFEDVIDEVRSAGAMDRVVFVTYSIDGAARLARLAPQAMIYTTVSSARELDVLERRNVDLSRIVAWVGTNAPDSALVQALAARGVETRFGMFGEGRDYANAVRSGAQIVAVDDAREAFRDINAADGAPGFGAVQCSR